MQVLWPGCGHGVRPANSRKPVQLTSVCVCVCVHVKYAWCLLRPHERRSNTMAMCTSLLVALMLRFQLGSRSGYKAPKPWWYGVGVALWGRQGLVCATVGPAAA